MIEEDLHHREKELTTAHLSMHPQKVIQVAEGVLIEEEEVETEEEKSNVTNVKN